MEEFKFLLSEDQRKYVKSEIDVCRRVLDSKPRNNLYWMNRMYTFELISEIHNIEANKVKNG